MLCQDCKQRVATVIFTEIAEGSKKVLHLCQTCVENRGVPTPVLKDPLEVDLVFKDLLEQLGEEDGMLGGGHSLDPETCRRCGWSFGNFRQTGLLGCPQCYRSFEVPLKDILRRVHGSNEHIGKVYERVDLFVAEEEVDSLKEELEEAVELEDFEKAAALRDRIQNLEQEED